MEVTLARSLAQPRSSRHVREAPSWRPRAWGAWQAPALEDKTPLRSGPARLTGGTRRRARRGTDLRCVVRDSVRMRSRRGGENAPGPQVGCPASSPGQARGAAPAPPLGLWVLSTTGGRSCPGRVPPAPGSGSALRPARCGGQTWRTPPPMEGPRLNENRLAGLRGPACRNGKPPLRWDPSRKTPGPRGTRPPPCTPPR